MHWHWHSEQTTKSLVELFIVTFPWYCHHHHKNKFIFRLFLFFRRQAHHHKVEYGSTWGEVWFTTKGFWLLLKLLCSCGWWWSDRFSASHLCSANSKWRKYKRGHASNKRRAMQTSCVQDKPQSSPLHSDRFGLVELRTRFTSVCKLASISYTLALSLIRWRSWSTWSRKLADEVCSSTQSTGFVTGRVKSDCWMLDTVSFKEECWWTGIFRMRLAWNSTSFPMLLALFSSKT